MRSMVVRHAFYLFVFSAILGGSGKGLAAEASAKFSYDADRRLTTAFYNGARCIIYTYDANGNRISQTTQDPTITPPTWGGATWGCFAWQ